MIRKPDYTPSVEEVSIPPKFPILGPFFPAMGKDVAAMIGEYDSNEPLSDLLKSSRGWRLGIHGLIDIVSSLPLIGFTRFDEQYSYTEESPDEKILAEYAAAGIVVSQTDILTGGHPSHGISRWKRELWTRVSNGHYEAICIEFSAEYGG